MFVTLPFFLAVGFGLGAIWANRKTIKEFFANRPERRALILLVVVVALVTVKFLGPYLMFDRPLGFMLGLGGIAVGVAGGLWFNANPDKRDKLVFVAACGLFLFAAALEYDTKLFDGLRKFGAGSVSVEFSGQASKTSSSTRPTSRVDDDQGGPFEGARRLDLSINYLRELFYIIFRDEQYVYLFSGEKLTDDYNAIIDHMDLATRDFFLYSCGIIETFSDSLSQLQEYYRNNLPIFAQYPSLNTELREAYMVRLAILVNANTGSTSNADFDKINKDNDELLKNTFKDVNKQIKNQRGEIDVLRDDIDVLLRQKPVQAQVPAQDERSRIRDTCKARGISASTFPTPDNLANGLDYEQSYGYFGYFAITVAVIEFAGGNREGAIQLLDRELRRQQQGFEKITQDSRLPDDHSNHERIFRAFRRLVMIVRLQSAEDNLIEISRDPGEDSSVDPIRIKLLEELNDNMNLVFSKIDPLEGAEPSIFATSGESGSRGKCVIGSKGDDTGKKSLVRWATARVIAFANALRVIAEQPYVVRVDPPLEEKMDSYAKYVTAFDVDCIDPTVLQIDHAQLEAALNRNVGGYWEAKADRFGEGADDERPVDTLSALCKAKEGYNRSLSAAGRLKPDPENSRLDTELTDYDSKVETPHLKDILKHLEARINSYPKGDVEKYCGI